jgi:hypothetical protein
METVARSIAWIATAFGFGALIAGCYPMPTYTPATVPSGAVAVPIKLLSERGIFGVPPPYVIAATSISSLESLVDAQYCHNDVCSSIDHWGPVPGVTGEVLLALPVTPDGSVIQSLAAWRGTGNTIIVDEGLLKTCSGGECAAPMQAMFLAAVPRPALPNAVVAFQVAGESSRSTVDLRLDAATSAG